MLYVLHDIKAPDVQRRLLTCQLPLTTYRKVFIPFARTQAVKNVTNRARSIQQNRRSSLQAD